MNSFKAIVNIETTVLMVLSVYISQAYDVLIYFTQLKIYVNIRTAFCGRNK